VTEDLLARGGATGRLHALDTARAAMMLLGLVLHAAASYITTPLGDAWPYRDAHTSAVLDLPLFVIHVFRMPAFFLLAGYFGALLYARDGLEGFMRNRLHRLVLPLVLFAPPLAILVGTGFLFAITRGTGSTVADVVGDHRDGAVSLMHLWFLWFLILYCAAAAVVLSVARRRPAATDAAASVLRRAGSRLLAPTVWIAVTTLTLLPMPTPAIDGSTSLLPPLRTLAAYGAFFLFGWLWRRSHMPLDSWAARCWQRFAVGSAATLVYLWVLIARPVTGAWAHPIACALMAAAMWCLVLGILGACVRYGGRPRPWVRSLSDAAYWIYLVHLPITIWTVGALARANWPAIVKFVVVVTVTCVVSAGTYFVWVRSSVIGTLLNGRRRMSPTEEGAPA
jgi:glucan biosynthesis protein C